MTKRQKTASARKFQALQAEGYEAGVKAGANGHLLGGPSRRMSREDCADWMRAFHDGWIEGNSLRNLPNGTAH